MIQIEKLLHSFSTRHLHWNIASTASGMGRSRVRLKPAALNRLATHSLADGPKDTPETTRQKRSYELNRSSF
jgi:hypothetical protein